MVWDPTLTVAEMKKKKCGIWDADIFKSSVMKSPNQFPETNIYFKITLIQVFIH